HSHYVFKIKSPQEKDTIYLDPWILSGRHLKIIRVGAIQLKPIWLLCVREIQEILFCFLVKVQYLGRIMKIYYFIGRLEMVVGPIKGIRGIFTRPLEFTLLPYTLTMVAI